MPPIPKPAFFLLAGVLWTARVWADPSVTVATEKSDAIYRSGEKIVWNVKVTGDEAAPIKKAAYVLREAGAKVLGQGTLDFEQGAARIETTLDEPGTILAEVTVPVPGQKDIRALGGAAVSPEGIKPSAPCPDDFDAFWKAKIEELKAVPENAVLEKGDSGKPGVDYWKITFDNIRGTHIHGQLARPSGDKKLPAMLIVQWAGVYPLDKSWATDRAAEGWLVLNIEAHDLPIDQPKAFYDDLKATTLKDYAFIGKEDRDKSYFVRMFLSDVRAADYLSERPDWDGKTLLVTGASQGGLQSFVTAALNPKVTGFQALVPAGCDDTGALAGRKPAWPFYVTKVGPEQADQLKRYSYFDAVNFASRVKCPALIGFGLIDETSPPTGVYAAVNQLKGPKELVVLPNSEHQDKNHSQAPYQTRAGKLRAAMLTAAQPH